MARQRTAGSSRIAARRRWAVTLCASQRQRSELDEKAAVLREERRPVGTLGRRREERTRRRCRWKSCREPCRRRKLGVGRGRDGERLGRAEGRGGFELATARLQAARRRALGLVRTVGLFGALAVAAAALRLRAQDAAAAVLERGRGSGAQNEGDAHEERYRVLQHRARDWHGERGRTSGGLLVFAGWCPRPTRRYGLRPPLSSAPPSSCGNLAPEEEGRRFRRGRREAGGGASAAERAEVALS